MNDYTSRLTNKLLPFTQQNGVVIKQVDIAGNINHVTPFVFNCVTQPPTNYHGEFNHNIRSRVRQGSQQLLEDCIERLVNEIISEYVIGCNYLALSDITVLRHDIGAPLVDMYIACQWFKHNDLLV